MARTHRILMLLALLLMIAPVAYAQTAAALYASGRYDDAIAAAQKMGDSESLAIAANAALVETNANDTLCLACAQRAEALARRAIATDAKNARAYVALARAIGFQSRIVGIAAARRAHYAEQAKAAAETALKLAPNDAWALAAIGGWHLEVVRGGGPLLADWFYGARLNTGLGYLKGALAAAPNDPVVALYYALAVSGVAFAGHRNDIEAALMSAVAAMPRDANERAMQTRAGKLLELLQANRQSEYMALVTHYQGVPPPREP